MPPDKLKRLLAALGSLLMVSACNSAKPGLLLTAPTPLVSNPQPNPTEIRRAGFPVAISVTSLAAGLWTCPNGEGDFCIEGSMSGDDPVCFPNWDASSHCKQYSLVAPADGALIATMTWGPTRGILFDPDIFLVAPDTDWARAFDEWPEKHVRLRMNGGSSYRIVVLSYGPEQLAFTLTLKVQQD